MRPSHGTVSLTDEVRTFTCFTVVRGVAGNEVELCLSDALVRETVPFDARVRAALARLGGAAPLGVLGSLVPPDSRPSRGRHSLTRDLREHCSGVVVQDGEALLLRGGGGRVLF